MNTFRKQKQRFHKHLNKSRYRRFKAQLVDLKRQSKCNPDTPYYFKMVGGGINLDFYYQNGSLCSEVKVIED